MTKNLLSSISSLLMKIIVEKIETHCMKIFLYVFKEQVY